MMFMDVKAALEVAFCAIERIEVIKTCGETTD
jgi:hypothetical protein